MADGPSTDTSKIGKYHRRLDRTPERNFDKLPEAEKLLISQIRQAKEDKVSELTRLKDDIEDREKTIEEERTLRMQAEEKLKSHLVDMYKSQAVNSELRDRLPRAKRQHMMKEDTDETYEQSPPVKNRQVTDEMVNDLADQLARHDIEDRVPSGHNQSNPEHNDYSRKSSVHSFGGSTDRAPGFMAHIEDRMSDRHDRRHSISDMSDLNSQRLPRIPRHHPYPPYQHLNPFLISVPPPIYSQHLPMYTTASAPPHNVISNLPFHRYLSMSTPVLYSPHGDQPLYQTHPLHHHHEHHPAAAAMSQAPPQTIPGLASTIPGLASASDKSDSGYKEKTTRSSNKSSCDESEHKFGYSPTGNPHHSATSDLGASVAGTSFSSLYPGVQMPPRAVGCSNSYVHMLLSQLESERHNNEKLQKEMNIMKMNLEASHLWSQQREVAAHNQLHEQTAELVKDIYTSQKSREDYLLDQVKPTNQNLDDPLTDTIQFDTCSVYDRSESHIYHSTDSEDFETEFDFDMTSSPSPEPDGLANQLLQETARAAKIKEIMQEQIENLTIERDRAIMKWRKAEKSLRQMRKTVEEKLLDEKNNLGKKEDKDSAKVHQLEDTIQVVQLAYCLQKSLFINDNMKHKTTLPGTPQAGSTPFPPIPDKTEIQDKDKLTLQVKELKVENEELSEKNKRLERQVKVLQRKVKQCHSINATF